MSITYMPFNSSYPSPSPTPSERERGRRSDLIHQQWAKHYRKVVYAHVYKLAKDMTALEEETCPRDTDAAIPGPLDSGTGTPPRYAQPYVRARAILLTKTTVRKARKGAEPKRSTKSKSKSKSKPNSPQASAPASGSTSNTNPKPAPSKLTPHDLSRAARIACNQTLQSHADTYWTQLCDAYLAGGQTNPFTREQFTRHIHGPKWLRYIAGKPPVRNWRRAPFRHNERSGNRLVDDHVTRYVSPRVPGVPEPAQQELPDLPAPYRPYGKGKKVGANRR